MTILQTLAQIPLMLYISMLLMPAALYGFLVSSKPKKAVPLGAANPADQLKEKKVDTRRELTSSLFMGATIAFGVAALIIIGGIIAEYKDSRGLFAVILPAATIPPKPNYVFPPAPQIDENGGIVGKNSIIDPSKAKGGLLD